MNKEDLIKYKEKLAKLTPEERKKRELYLKHLSDGTLQGPMTGFSSIDKQWLQYYDEEDLEQSIPKMKVIDYLFLNNKDNLNKNAINFYGVKIKYKELFEKIDLVAKSLIASGVKKGDIVTMAMANTPETVYLFYALNKIGAITNVIDPRFTAEEMEREINAVDSNVLISLDMCYETSRGIIKRTNVKKTICLSAVESLPFAIRKLAQIKNKKIKFDNDTISWKEFLKNGKRIKTIIDTEYKENFPITVVHTGGTTGIPKGVLLTNENFIAMANMHKFGGLDYTKDDKFLNILPPFIAYCLCNGINMPLTLGLEVTLVPKFEVEEFPKLLDKFKPNHVLSGPILWECVTRSDIEDLSYLKTPVSGGDSMNSEIENRINEFFAQKNANVKVAQGYGMTEVSSAAVFSNAKANKLGSVGIPFIKNTVSIFDPYTLEEKQVNQEGEIWISTPTAMAGYYKNIDATNALKVRTADGLEWIRTGDIGKISETGNVYILGRMKRMIVRSGNKIFPANVENLVMQIPEIINCAIVGYADEIERKVPVIHIVLADNCQKGKEEIVEQIKNLIKLNLPDFNIPTKYIFRNELPLTGINKVDFKTLESEELPEEEIILYVKSR